MNSDLLEGLAKYLVTFVYHMVLGLWTPVGLLYVVNFRKPELGGKLRQKINAIGRVIFLLVLFFFVAEVISSSVMPIYYIKFHSNLGFLIGGATGLAAFFIGYRRGKRRKASALDLTPA